MDIEELEKRGQDMANRKIPKPSLDDAKLHQDIILQILNTDVKISELKRRYKLVVKNSYLYHVYKLLVDNDLVTYDLAKEEKLRKTLQIKPCKSWSGITSITVFTTAYPEYTRASDGQRVKQPFSCSYNCHFCVNQPGQPRSYILNEPGVLRATRNDHQCVPQMHDRLNTLYTIGHTALGKLEVLVLGGTFASYPEEYRREFTRDIFYGANTFWDEGRAGHRRNPLSLEQEKEINTVARSRVIGITFETRGDTINAAELRLYRELGCTRIQLGIQHIDDAILKKNNRQCPHWKTVAAIKLMKENGFKIDGHFMPNLPGATVEADHDMMIDNFLGVKSHKHLTDGSEEYVLANPDIQVDQIKIYPTAVLPYTEVEKWFLDGSYKPYSDALVKDLVIKVKSLMFPFIRINRIIRDFFPEAIYAGGGREMAGLRPDAQREMVVECKCCRCAEPRTATWDGSYVVHVIKYNASEGDEYFIAARSKDLKILYGFARLRLDNGFNKVFPELNQAALLRELHVYSQTTFVGEKGLAVQHKGLGTRLMKEAETIAKRCYYYKMAVIAGVGARTFYERLGYTLEGIGEFMVKRL